MALWNKIQSNPSLFKQVEKHYNGRVPIIVRHYLADWLEEQFLNAAYSGPELEVNAITFGQNLMVKLNQKSTEIGLEESESIRLQEATGTLYAEFSNSIVELYNFFKNSLEKEFTLANPEVVMDKLKEIYTKVHFNNGLTRDLGCCYENFCLLLHHITDINAQCMQEPNNLNLSNTRKDLEARKDFSLAYLTQKRIEIVNNFKVVIEKTVIIQDLIIFEFLENWKYVQSRTRNGFKEEEAIPLNTIQSWFESLGNIICFTKSQISKVIELKGKLYVDEGNLIDYLPQLLSDINNLLETLMRNSIVIEGQPLQIVQKGNKFKNSVSLRLLAGNILNIRHTEQRISVTIECESNIDAKITLVENGKNTEKKERDELMMNHESRWDVEKDEFNHEKFTAHFKNLMIKNRPRMSDPRANNNRVVEEKTCLFFESSFDIGDSHFSLWTYSLPIAITVHANQNPQAWSSIVWDAAYATLNRRSLAVPIEGDWNLLSAALSAKFNLVTGRALITEDLEFIRDKAVKGGLINERNMISWNKFCKDVIPGYSYSLWDWFYSAAKITKDHLEDVWKAGLIAGFISRTAAEEKLKVCAAGTFIIRFSDGEPGAVTIAYRDDTEVVHIQPFTSETLKTRCLADSIVDLDELLTLYPNTSKEIFTKYAGKSEQKTVKEGYVAAGVHMSLSARRKSGSSVGNSLNGILDGDAIQSIISDVASMDFQMDSNAYATVPYDSNNDYTAESYPGVNNQM